MLIVACVLLAGLSACVLFVLNNSSVPQEAVLQEDTENADGPDETASAAEWTDSAESAGDPAEIPADEAAEMSAAEPVSGAETPEEAAAPESVPAEAPAERGDVQGILEDGTPVTLKDVSLNSLTVRSVTDPSFYDGCPERTVELLTPNPYSRAQEPLEEVHDIVIHYVGNAGTSAKENRDYFESLQDGSASASSHFIVGLDGEILQCVSLSEIAYATKNRNVDTVSIEVCHPEADGKFSDVTYRSAVRLTAWLCKTFRIGPEHVIRHYDVTGKLCPLYYVEHEDAWAQYLADVRTEYEQITAS